MERILAAEDTSNILSQKFISQLVFSSIDMTKITDKRKISEKIPQKYTFHILNNEGGSILWDPVHEPNI
jgi:hypothetical protein